MQLMKPKMASLVTLRMRWICALIGVGLITLAAYAPVRKIYRFNLIQRSKPGFDVLAGAAFSYWDDHNEAAPSLAALVEAGYLDKMPINPFTGKPVQEINYVAGLGKHSTAQTIDLVHETELLPGNALYLVLNIEHNKQAQQDAYQLHGERIKSVYNLFLLGPEPGRNLGALTNVHAVYSSGRHFCGVSSRSTYEMPLYEFFAGIRGFELVPLDAARQNNDDGLSSAKTATDTL